MENPDFITCRFVIFFEPGLNSDPDIHWLFAGLQIMGCRSYPLCSKICTLEYGYLFHFFQIQAMSSFRNFNTLSLGILL